MKIRTIIVTALILVFVGIAGAQSVGASLFTVAPKQTTEGDLYFNYDSGYGVRAIRPFGEEGVEQRVGVVYGLTPTLSLLSTAGGVIEEGSGFRVGAAQVELFADLFSQEKTILNLSAGAGFLREYGGVNVLMARFAAGRNFEKWQLNGNMVLEKPFEENRDAFDVITTFSTAWHALKKLHVGFDLIGEDLEGFWDEEEAEGGAKMMFGPTLYYHPTDKMHLRLGGGPIYYLTSNTPTSQAPRILPPGDSGYAVRFSMIYGI